ncbi:MAG: tetratricopeptide repeat protein [Prolixibacteraceae bacterium]|nr:tetratricopeptide repeat protein [Prolixibacteraceae bacterium]MBN2775960.1 tetratricopeptide repeat protein [Prolixibacteraceae bacterium]
MGIAYKELKNYDKAIEYYKKAIETDPKDAFPYNNLANVYRNRKEFEQASEFYQKAIEIDSKFVHPYNGLGNVFLEQKNYKKAIELFEKAIQVDPKYIFAYYNLGYTLYESEEYNKALECFEKYKDLTKSAPDYYTRQSESAISELKKLIKNEEFIHISDLVNKIKKHLLVKTGCITHYTSLSVAKLLILNKSLLRLSEGAFLNDTSEGRELCKFLNFNYSPVSENELNASPFAQKPFIGSFVLENKYNDLTMWRMYGKEKNEEAKGCSNTLKMDQFTKSLKNKMIPEKDSETTTITSEESNFYKVAYRKNTNHNQFIINDVDEDELKIFNTLMDNLAEKVKEYNSKERKQKERQNLIERLNEIAYLFKTAEYQHENEVRLVINGVGFDKKVDTSFDPTRVYIELVSIKPLIRRITLGPKVEKADEWAAAFYYSLDKEDSEHEEDFHPEVSISRLPFK